MKPAPSETMEIRRYEPADRVAIRALHDEVLYDVGSHLGNGPWDGDLYDVGNVYLRDGGGEFLVGVLDGEIDAMGALRLTSGDGRRSNA